MNINEVLTLALLLLAAHAIADFPLQGDFLSRAKSRYTAIPGISWVYALFMHASIHGAFVAILTGYWWLGVAEMLIHAFVDYLKCERHISFNTDQYLHLMCKLLWLVIACTLSLAGY